MENPTPRQAQILSAVAECYIATGRPVGSKHLCRKAGFDVSPSTMRAELARLEEMGYLRQPHTSAGRVPTDRGYRFYVDHAPRYARAPKAPEELMLSLKGEVGEAIRGAAALLARSTGMLAMISSPERGDVSIRHIEVLQLQPDLVAVVVINATGGVSRKLFAFEGSVDPGLVKWAHGFLNDAAVGLDQGSRLLKHRLADAELEPMEKSFIEALSPALLEYSGGDGPELVMEGAPKLLSRLELEDDFDVRDLVEMLDRRDELMKMLGSTLAEYRVFLRIGRENPSAAMRGCTLVAANYGPSDRNLGTVGVLGPTRMDYPVIIGSVEQTARCLSSYLEEIF